MQLLLGGNRDVSCQTCLWDTKQCSAFDPLFCKVLKARLARNIFSMICRSYLLKDCNEEILGLFFTLIHFSYTTPPSTQTQTCKTI